MKETPKDKVARAIASKVCDGDILGIGSGSTVELAVQHIGNRIAKDGLKVSGVPTSLRIAHIAAACGITVLSGYTDTPITWAFDGADEVDSELNLIKGGGAAMLGEKIIARRAPGRFVVIVTPDKLVSRLGEKFAVPVEVIAEAQFDVIRELKLLGAVSVVERSSSAKYGPAISEHGHIVLDARFDFIPKELEVRIKQITGVVESGLFMGYTNEVLLAEADGVWKLSKSDSGYTKSFEGKFESETPLK